MSSQLKTCCSYQSEITSLFTPWYWQYFDTVKIWGQSNKIREEERSKEGLSKSWKYHAFQILFQVVSVLGEKGFYRSLSLENNPGNKLEQCLFSISEALRSHEWSALPISKNKVLQVRVRRLLASCEEPGCVVLHALYVFWFIPHISPRR